MRRLAKTSTYWVLHIAVASGLAFALTGDIHAALAIGLLEPTVQAVVFFFHERAWERVPEHLPLPGWLARKEHVS
jgi:uncharacterized membrane protein